MEPTEIHEFSEEMREGGEKSLTNVSLIISVLAVLVAMVTVLGHREHTEAVLMQTRVADQWNEYQARKLRVQNMEVASDLLSLLPGSDAGAVHAKLGEYKAHLKKWQSEIEEDATQAHELENEVQRAERKAARFDLSEALLEIAVVLASITLLTRHQRYALAATVLGVAGVVLAASAFLVR
jgi:chromosome segregation ATPase